jgi:hypothetical protein
MADANKYQKLLKLPKKPKNALDNTKKDVQFLS